MKTHTLGAGQFVEFCERIIISSSFKIRLSAVPSSSRNNDWKSCSTAMVSDMTYVRVLQFPSIKAGRGGYWHFAFALAISHVLVLDLVVLVVVGFNV